MFDGIKAKYKTIKDYSKKKESLRFSSMKEKTAELKMQNKIKADLEKEKTKRSMIKAQTRNRKLAPIRKVAKDIRNRRKSNSGSSMFQSGMGSRNIFDDDNRGSVFDIGMSRKKPKTKKKRNKSIIIKIN